MRIKVDCICENMVQFSSIYGNGSGELIGKSPVLTQEYYVELEVREKFSFLDFNLSDSQMYTIDMVNDKVCLTMQLVDYEDTGCASFLLGDSIIDIETRYNCNFEKLVHKYLSLQVSKLYLYIVNIV